MTALPRLTAKELIPTIERAGCSFLRQKGSHRIYRAPTGKRVAVPCHAGKILHPKVVKSILKGMGMTAEDFRKLL